jgi:Fic family protein
MKELSLWLRNKSYRLKPSTILKLNRIALESLSRYAGVFRPSDIKITGSQHQPVPAEQVPGLVEEFCDYVNEHWHARTAVHLSAYALWRLNWIHAFVDGNGRTSRIVAYLILCAKLGYRLPGTKTIPEQIAQSKSPYYKALEAADRAAVAGTTDVAELEKLIEGHLAVQLYEVHKSATGNPEDDRQAVAQVTEKDRSSETEEAVVSPQKLALLSWIEKHPALTGLIGTAIATMIAILFAS